MNNPNIAYQGINSQGNAYTIYTDGSFSYSNKNEAGSTVSHYYDTGNGHSFFSKNNTPDAPGYSFYENRNQGFRVYLAS